MVQFASFCVCEAGLAAFIKSKHCSKPDTRLEMRRALWKHLEKAALRKGRLNLPTGLISSRKICCFIGRALIHTRLETHTYEKSRCNDAIRSQLNSTGFSEYLKFLLEQHVLFIIWQKHFRIEYKINRILPTTKGLILWTKCLRVYHNISLHIIK